MGTKFDQTPIAPNYSSLIVTLALRLPSRVHTTPIQPQGILLSIACGCKLKDSRACYLFPTPIFYPTYSLFLFHFISTSYPVFQTPNSFQSPKCPYGKDGYYKTLTN